MSEMSWKRTVEHKEMLTNDKTTVILGTNDNRTDIFLLYQDRYSLLLEKPLYLLTTIYSTIGGKLQFSVLSEKLVVCQKL